MWKNKSCLSIFFFICFRNSGTEAVHVPYCGKSSENEYQHDESHAHHSEAPAKVHPSKTERKYVGR